MFECAAAHTLITVLIKSGSTALIYKGQGNLWT